ncbi:CvpA family protein [Singulisphaera sp. Ch08]|uniref:CvpA family protein n=1 Tax=Singulisphaera sp. Ch08 TaxID=3120278 RepID=A0AAU7CGX4_9BACT
MGLDLALGGLVLVMAIRGWLKGFLLQAIRLVGLILCVYAADPVRDQIKPRVIGHLPTIRPELIDRMLWWSAAVASYLILVGLASLAVKLYRRQPYGMEDESRRGDQFAGSLLGIAKALVVATFLVAGIEKYAVAHLKAIPWAVQQVETSRSMALNEQYHPVPRIWAAPPVQHFVRHVQRMGLNRSEETDRPQETEAAPPVRTASRTPQLQWGAPGRGELNPSDLDAEVVDAIETIRQELLKAEHPR